MQDNELVLGDRAIGVGAPVFVIADVGVAHGGNVSQLCRLIDAAVQSGADGVRVHAHRVERLFTSDTARGDLVDQTLYRKLRNSELNMESHIKLKQHADGRGISYIPAPSDEETVDSLDQLGVHAFRVASCDLTHIPLLRRIASKGKPVFLSTGMSYLSEVADAIWALRSGGAVEIVLMHCVSCRPAPPEALNLRAIQTLREHFGLPVGYSDHSEGAIFPLVAATLGAVAVEKTLALDKISCGPEQFEAIEPAQMLAMVQSLRALELCLGDGRKHPASCEEANRTRDRKSIVAACDIRAYESITQWMLTCKRPGGGIEPGRMERLVGMQARRNISKNTILRWDDLIASAGREPEAVDGLLKAERDMTGSVRPGFSGNVHRGTDFRAADVKTPRGGRLL